MNIRHLVVLITGASRGIGAATAVAFARKGWRVAITARSASEGQRLDHQLRRPDGALMAGSLASTAAAIRGAGAEAFAHPMDLMEAASLDAAFDAVLAHFGRIDIVVNNAGGTPPRGALQTSDKMFEAAFHFNVTTAFTLCRESALPIVVFDLMAEGNLRRLLLGEAIGTIVE